MMKLFLKVFYIQFIWIILLANLLFFFDYVSIMPNYTGADLSNSYFGVSTFLNALENLDNTQLGKFALTMQSTQARLFSLASRLFNSFDWNSIQNYFQTANNILDWLFAIANLLYSVLKVISSIFVYIGAIAVYMLYFTMLLMNMVYTLFGFMNGQYNTPLPSSQLLDEGVICNCITPLLTAV